MILNMDIPATKIGYQVGLDLEVDSEPKPDIEDSGTEDIENDVLKHEIGRTDDAGTLTSDYEGHRGYDGIQLHGPRYVHEAKYVE